MRFCPTCDHRRRTLCHRCLTGTPSPEVQAKRRTALIGFGVSVVLMVALALWSVVSR